MPLSKKIESQVGGYAHTSLAEHLRSAQLPFFKSLLREGRKSFQEDNGAHLGSALRSARLFVSNIRCFVFLET